MVRQARGKHDWYCYDCHKAGEVLECAECWRVYHVACTDVEAETGGLASLDSFVCAVCKVGISAIDKGIELKDSPEGVSVKG